MAPRIVPDNETSDLGEQLATLRNDLASLSSTVSDYVKSQANSAASHVKGAAEDAASAGARLASQASEKVKSSSAELETYVERNPWNAVLIAGGIGLVLGLISNRSR